MPKPTVKKSVKAPKAKSVKAPKKTKGQYYVELQTNGEMYRGSGDDVYEIIKGFGLDNTKTKTVVSVVRGDRSAVKVFNVMYARRLFRNPTLMTVFSHHLTSAVNAG